MKDAATPQSILTPEQLANQQAADNVKLKTIVNAFAIDNGEQSTEGMVPLNMQGASLGEGIVRIDYTNWRGERRMRTIRPHGMTFGSNQWHQKRQWLLWAHDLDKHTNLWFAMAGIHAWEAL